MRVLLVSMVMALTLTAAACGDDDSASDDTASSGDTASSDDTASEVTAEVDVPDVIGDSVEDATATLEAAGLELRVIRRDGEDLMATMDFVTNRVNVAVETQDDGTEVVTEIVSIG